MPRAAVILAANLTDTFLMMNGDAFSDLDYGHLIAFHRQAGNAMTIAPTEREIDTEFGILHTDAGAVTEPAALAHAGYWLDLGRRDDFEQAQRAA